MGGRKDREIEKYKNTRLYVKVKDNNVDKALAQFKKRVKNSGLLKELRENEFYEKPSIKRRRRKKMGKLRSKQFN
jgi:small subunit ribosomal protein S21|tara:strand:+ start:2107 stop:2331 length:225 start_codon:yes stop_codon:yes gene_type:complete